MATQLLKTVKPSGGDYTTLYSCLNANEQNLVTADKYFDVEIDGDWSATTDSTAVLIQNYTTDATRDIRIYTTLAARSLGVWSTDYYKLVKSDASGHVLQINAASYVKIVGLQIHHNHASDYQAAIQITNPTNTSLIQIGYCILRGYGDSNWWDRGIDSVNNGPLKVYNCVLYNWLGSSAASGAIYLSSNETTTPVELYNSTIAMNGQGVVRLSSTGAWVIKNCAVFNNTDDFVGSPATIDYCASDDGDGTNPQDFTAEATDWAAVFTDYANKDFSLKDYSTNPCCKGQGTDNPGSGLYSDDIKGVARSSPWDIGAFEYPPAGETIRSYQLDAWLKDAFVAGTL